MHIVTDSTVAPLYLDALEAQLPLPVSHTVIPAGEEHKRLSTVEGIYHDMLAAGMTRKDLVIALGGGVVGDITGFAAATFPARRVALPDPDHPARAGGFLGRRQDGRRPAGG